VTAVELPAGSQPTATYNSTTGALQLGIPRCSCAGEIPPPPNTNAQKCGAARLYAERILVLSSKLATDLSTGLTAFQAATATGAAVAFAFGVSITPPIAIALAAVELFASIGAAVISGYNDQATQDAIAKAVYCALRRHSITTANGMALVIGNAFSNDANKRTWFQNCARLLGDDLTARILGIGAQEPSNACELYQCSTVYTYDFCTVPEGTITIFRLTKSGCTWTSTGGEAWIVVQLPFAGRWRILSAQNHTYTKAMYVNTSQVWVGAAVPSPWINGATSFQ
jgi:hypothetical protein